MKATGIVRRIDDLGRVVIPKEIRRTMRIREGDPLEIYTDSDGRVIFKKYSPVGELGTFAHQYAEVLFKVCASPVIICDRERVVSAAGMSKKEISDRRVTGALEALMEERRSFINDKKSEKLIPIEGFEKEAFAAIPILASGDVCGAVVMLESENAHVNLQVNVKLIQAAAMFLAKQMEE